VFISKTSAMLLKEICSGMHSDPKFGRRRGGVTYGDARKKRVLERCFGLHHSEKNLWNSVPSTFCHKNVPE
jgi:hypothetical protein